jgi:hypothetical protein
MLGVTLYVHEVEQIDICDSSHAENMAIILLLTSGGGY